MSFDVAYRTQVDQLISKLSPEVRFRSVVSAFGSGDTQSVENLMRSAPRVSLVGIHPDSQRLWSVWVFATLTHEIRIRDELLRVCLLHARRDQVAGELENAVVLLASMLQGWCEFTESHGLSVDALRKVAGVDQPSCPLDELASSAMADSSLKQEYRDQLEEIYRLAMHSGTAAR